MKDYQFSLLLATIYLSTISNTFVTTVAGGLWTGLFLYQAFFDKE